MWRRIGEGTQQVESDPRVQFVDQLKQLKRLSGEPTLAALQAKNPAWLTKQTVSKMLAGTFRRVPPWERIAAFVTACVQIGRDKNLTMPAENELLDQWRHQHALLAVALDHIPPVGLNVPLGYTPPHDPPPADTSPRLRGIPFGEPLVGHTLAVEWGAWGEVGERSVLATGSIDGSVRLWDPIAGKQIDKPLIGHTASVTWGAWGQVNNGPVLATGSADGTVRLWDPAAGEQLSDPLINFGTATMWGAWGKVDGQPVLATGSLGGRVRLWEPSASEQHGKPLIGHTQGVTWGAWGQINARSVLATGSIDGTVRVWDPKIREQPIVLPIDHPFGARWGAWAQVEGRALLVTGTPSDPVHLWDLTDGKPDDRTLTGRGGTGATWGAWVQVNGQARLSTGGPDGTVHMWDANGNRHGTPLSGHRAHAAWSAWGQIGRQSVLAISSDDRTVCLWDPRSIRQHNKLFIGHTSPIHWGAWGQVDGRPMLATGSSDGTIRLCEVVEDRPVQRLPSYRSDAVGEADALSRSGDALALAELITARTARPPLAVGLFGDWGEGKSHFLDLLREHVTIATLPDNPLAHHDIRQVSFNAWHYAETDLWASLVAELFSQLASPGGTTDPVKHQRQQSRLMAEVIAERELPQRLHAARDRRDDLQHAVRRANRDTIPSWAKLTPSQQQDLREVVGEGAEKFYRSAVRFGSGTMEGGRAAYRSFRKIPKRTVIVAGALLVLLIAVTAGISWALPAVSQLWPSLPAVALVTVIVQTWIEVKRRASPAWQAVRKAVRTIARADEAQRARVQTAATVAAEEVKALEREMQNLHAAGQLAGFVADRVGDGSYRSRLGVMTQIREDFQRMANLLSKAHTQHEFDLHLGTLFATEFGASPLQPQFDAVGDELPKIDRIVLYIDDLDRCPPQRVVAMLEAIHLLLALDLFVVVVAVDPRWLLRAITSHYKDLLHTAIPAPTNGSDGMVDLDDDELWAATPAQYLEKIFQVVLTLPPLHASGYQHLLRTLVGTRPDQPDNPSAAPTSTASPASSPAGTDFPDNPIGVNDADDVSESMFGVRLPAARVVERVDPLTLDPGELALLDLLGPPTLITTPRAVKRLANSYGLLTALRHADRAGDLAPQSVMVNDIAPAGFRAVSHYPYRAGLVLLGALVAFPALGPALLVHLHRSAADDRHSTWTAFMQSLQPRYGKDGWSNAADDVMTAVQAQNWRTLHRGLVEVTDLAAAADLALPDLLGAWAEWVVPVGRLSFPAGRIVNNLRHYGPY